jgi:hypothetical protein
MTELPTPYSSSVFPTRVDRQVSKALAAIDASQVVALRRDEARMERVATTTRRGMIRAAEIGALEAGLVQAVPAAAAYVHASAVAGALGIASVVYDSTGGLR